MLHSQASSRAAAAWSKVPSSGKAVVGHDDGHGDGFDVFGLTAGSDLLMESVEQRSELVCNCAQAVVERA